MSPLILLVDDQPANLAILERLLGPVGYRLSRASGGHAALQAIDRDRPDLVLLDVNMPDLDGIEVLTRLRAREVTRTPVILLTGSSDRESRLRGFEAGADDFLEKPVDRALLLARVRNLLSLKAAADKLAQRERAKGAFVANMSHEIRSPMNAIMGYAQLMARDASISPKHRRAVETILRSGEHLLGLINDVLEIAKIEAGAQTVTVASVDLKQLLEDVRLMFELRASSKGLVFEISRSPTLPRYIASDELKLRQILVNLLGNAIKFTVNGRVAVKARTGADASGAMRLLLEVEDTGPGIDQADQSRLFVPFFQTRVGIEAQGGTGLGLALSSGFARALGGSISVESVPGKGTRFLVDLPCVQGEPAVRPETKEGRVVGLMSDGPPPRILVADDGDEQRWVEDLLVAIGFQVLHVTNGAEAVAAFHDWEPDLILMDLNMPVMSGQAATRAIRDAKDARRVPIVIVSASAYAEGGAVLSGAADGFLRKPLSEAALLAEIRRQLGLEYRRGMPIASRQASAASSGRLQAVVPTRLPAATVEALVTACGAADYERALELLDGLDQEHALTADLVRALLERFDYDAVIAVLRK